jgi:hypothetical protein
VAVSIFFSIFAGGAAGVAGFGFSAAGIAGTEIAIAANAKRNVFDFIGDFTQRAQTINDGMAVSKIAPAGHLRGGASRSEIRLAFVEIGSSISQPP